MERASHDPLAPSRPPWRVASLAIAACAARLLLAAAPAQADVAARSAAVGALLVLGWLPAALSRFARRNDADRWRAETRAAWLALGVGLLMCALGLALREVLAQPQPLLTDRAPWPWAELAAAQALLFCSQLVPLPGSEGSTLIEAALRRGRPQLVAARLVGRLRGGAVALVALLLALVPGAGRDPISLAVAVLFAVLAWRGERALFQQALAREQALQLDARSRPALLQPLSPAQFRAFAAVAARAYAEATRARHSSPKPIASAASSTPTEPE